MRYVNYLKKPVFWLIIPFSIYLIFGLVHINQFETADEALWISDPFTGRIHGYWQALSDHNWIQTRINDKPGISLALISGIGIFFEGNPQEKLLTSKEESPRIYNPEANQRSYLAFRLPILIFNGLMSLFFFYAIRRLTRNDFIAFLTATLILLSPILLGISQIINPDALLWVFSFFSLLAFLLFLKDGGKKDAILASVFLGLSFLTKYTGIILIPFFFLAGALHFWFQYEKNLERSLLKKKIINFLIAYIGIIFGSLVVFSLMMPAVLIHPKFLFQGTIDFKGMMPIFLFIIAASVIIFLDALFFKSAFIDFILKKILFLKKIAFKSIYLFLLCLIFLVFINWSFGNNFLGINNIPFDSNRSALFVQLPLWKKMLLEFYPFTFSLTPLVFFSILFFWTKSVFKKSEDFFPFIISLYILVFFLGVIRQNLFANIRYGIIMHPIMMTLAALGIYEFSIFFGKRKYVNGIIWVITVFACSISIWLIKPYYFNYTNDLLPKNKIITGAWGYGGYEAAAYLNALPNAKNLRVWSDYEGFCSFFSGKCVRISTAINYKEEFPKSVDYFVSSRRGNITNENVWRYLKKNLVLQKQPVWELIIGGRPENFVRIFKNNVIN